MAKVIISVNAKRQFILKECMLKYSQKMPQNVLEQRILVLAEDLGMITGYSAWMLLQHKLLIPAPVDRTYAGAWLCKHPWITCHKNKPSTYMTHVACE